jgi:hypothetical protein
MINVLVVSKKDININNKGIEVDYIDNIDSAISYVKTKFYDAVIIEFSIDNYSGTKITQFYPHYRTILIINPRDGEKLKEHRNGFYAVCNSYDNLDRYVEEIVKKYPKKEEDSLIAIMNIHGTIKSLQKTYDFIKNSFSTIHNKLKSLEEAQTELSNNFEEFKKQKAINEQFFIDTVIEIKDTIKNG